MELGEIGSRVARGQPVELDNVGISPHQAEDALAHYEGALLHIFDAATGSKSVDCPRAAKHLVTCAEQLVACCVLYVGNIDLLDKATRMAVNNRDSLRVLDQRHWRRAEMQRALAAAGAETFRGRWAPLVDVC